MVLQAILQTVGSFSRQCLLTSSLRSHMPLKASVAFIVSKALRDPAIKKPAPWPYETKKFGFFQQFYDSTIKRLDENSKIIVVEGNIASGKTALAKQLAEEFDMRFVPEQSADQSFITYYGYDIRALDDILPHSFKCCDLETYYKNPHHHNVSTFQLTMFMLRYNDYIESLAHLLNTGQGIVLDRCVYSDFVFMQTMYESGYVSDGILKYYRAMYENCVTELLRPHLIIYLDVPVDILQKRIKERNNPIEVGSKVLTDEYLQGIANHYTHRYLPDLGTHAELLIYDWSNFGDVEVVVEDIEKIDLNKDDVYETKLSDWRLRFNSQWNELRMLYTNEKFKLMQCALLTEFLSTIPEVYHPSADVIAYREIMDKIPGQKYRDGFNPEMGDSVYFNSINYRPKFTFPIR